MVNWETRAEISRGESDWMVVRECFVRAFYGFPLYKYLVPDDGIRSECLRAIFEATYDVTVRSGIGFLICINLYDADEEANKKIENTRGKPIGGVIMVPPAEDGVGWERKGVDVEAYARAYKRSKLGDISPEALEKILEYERWEAENVETKIFAAKLPLWQGLICAIDPVYAGRGCGSLHYTECLRIMVQFKTKGQKNGQCGNSFSYNRDGCTVDGARHPTNHEGDLKLERGCCAIQTNGRYQELKASASALRLALDNKCMPDGPDKGTDGEATQTNAEELRTPVTPILPLMVALAYSNRAAEFHERNGLHFVRSVPFHGLTKYGEVRDKPIFNVNVFATDPLQIDEIGTCFG